MKPLKVLIVTGSLSPMKCGVGDYTFALAEQLSVHCGVAKVVAITSTSANKVESDSLEILSIIDKWNSNSLMKIVSAVKQIKPDVVHIQYPTTGYERFMVPSFMPVILRLLGFKVVQTWHEPLSYKGWFRYLPNTLACNALVVIEPDYLATLPLLYRWLLRNTAIKIIPVASSIPKANLSDMDRSAIRTRFNATQKRLVAYFGFASPGKGIDDLLEIANPEQDQLILICELDREILYHKHLLDKLSEKRWQGKVFVTGFLPSEEVGLILAASDVAVFPFVKGLGLRNTSYWAARAQGVFVLTTHRSRRGYYKDENVFYAAPSDIRAMHDALGLYAGNRNPSSSGALSGWSEIADEHVKFYTEILGT
jgi:glycosyltransferase involved in cell wall biosynthesis